MNSTTNNKRARTMRWARLLLAALVVFSLVPTSALTAFAEEVQESSGDAQMQPLEEQENAESADEPAEAAEEPLPAELAEEEANNAQEEGDSLSDADDDADGMSGVQGNGGMTPLSLSEEESSGGEMELMAINGVVDVTVNGSIQIFDYDGSPYANKPINLTLWIHRPSANSDEPYTYPTMYTDGNGYLSFTLSEANVPTRFDWGPLFYVEWHSPGYVVDDASALYGFGSLNPAETEWDCPWDICVDGVWTYGEKTDSAQPRRGSYNGIGEEGLPPEFFLGPAGFGDSTNNNSWNPGVYIPGQSSYTGGEHPVVIQNLYQGNTYQYAIKKGVKVKEQYVNESNASIKAEDTSYQWLEGTGPSTSYSSSAPATIVSGGKTYYHQGYRLDTNPTKHSGTYSDNLSNSVTIVNLYAPAKATYTVKHLFASDNSTASPDQTGTLDVPDALGTAPASVPNYAPLRVTVKGPSDVVHNQVAQASVGSPITGWWINPTVQGNYEIIYYYAPDGNNNGVPDYKMTEQVRMADSSTISGYPDVESFVDIGDTYTPPAHATIPTLDYQGYTQNGGTLVPTLDPPAITNVSADNTYVYVFDNSAFQVDVEYVDRSLTPLSGGSLDYTVSPAPQYGDTVTAQVKPVTDMCLVDWSLDGGVTLEGNTMPVINSITGSATITLIYGQDKGDDTDITPTPDGIEDVNITKQWYTSDGITQLKPDQLVYRNVPGPFAEAGGTIASYDYVGYSLDGGTQQTGAPSVALVGGVDHTIRYFYDLQASPEPVTVKFEDRSGATVKPDISTTVSQGLTYAPSASDMAVFEYTLIDWKLSTDAGWRGNTAPSETVPAGGITMILRYGQDKGDDTDITPTPDGIEDVNITKQWYTSDGITQLKPDQLVYRNIPGPFAEAGGTIASYDYVGYTIDGGTQQTGTPSVALVGGTDHTVRYLYQLQASPQPVTVKFEDRSGATVKPDISTTVSQGLTYAPSASDMAVTDFTLIDWKLSTDAGWRGDTNPTETVPAGGITMILRYGQDKGDDTDVTPTPDGIEDVNITKQWRSIGGATLKGDQLVYRNIPGPYAEAGGAIAGYDYVGYKVDGGAQQTGTPSIALVGGVDHTVTYLYKLQAGLESITVKFEDRQGNQVKPDIMIGATLGATYAPGAVDIAVTDYVLIDWKLSTEASWRGDKNPSETVTAGGFTMILRYGQDKGDDTDHNPQPDGIEDVNITKQWQTVSGTQLKADRTVYRNIPGPFAEAGGAIAGYDYVGYKVDGGAQQLGNPSLTLAGGVDHTVTYLYTKSSTPAPNPAPNPAPTPAPNDHGNYLFVKKPSAKYVDPGDMVDYSFSNFGNGWGKPITDYSISDLPDKGLDFVCASMPAFAHSTGVNYDIVLYTNYQTKGFIAASGISAESAYTFWAPALASGEYITAVTLEFGNVPVDFAVGDSLVMRFRVWDNPPASVLNNTGVLSYRVDGEWKEFTTGGPDTQVILNGKFVNGWIPQTGDFVPVATLASLALLAGVGVAFAAVRARRSDRKGKGSDSL